VAVGNEQAYVFYEQFGFFPRRTLLEQKKALKRKQSFVFEDLGRNVN